MFVGFKLKTRILFSATKVKTIKTTLIFMKLTI